MKMKVIAIIGVTGAIVLAIVVAVLATTIPQVTEAPSPATGTGNEGKPDTNANKDKAKSVLKSVVVLSVGNKDGKPFGVLTLSQENPTGPVTIIGNLTGLKPNGMHGFHVHQTGDIREGCKSTGGHFNPQGKDHGAPTASVRHVGDLGNVQADNDGNVQVKIEDKQISLNGANSIIGRAFVVHENQDDLGLGGHPDSLKTGNAGGRIVCGIVAIA